MSSASVSPLETQPAETGPAEVSSAKVPAWRDVLSREEIDSLLAFDDLRGWATLLLNWALVFGSMALVAVWPNPLTVIVALLVIGTRQLGLAVIMHDAAHRAYFSSKPLNDFAGSWLAGYPIWSDLYGYRPYHLRHHAKTWTDEDPDKHLATPFPITRASLLRKFGRDLSGRTGLKFVGFAIKRDFGSEGNWLVRARTALGSRTFRGMLITNAVLLGVLSAVGWPALYLLWVVAYLTTNTFVTRIRAIAEHSMSPDITHELRNTRTTIASWLERLLIAPNRVNYHLEHHLLMTVPHYNLPRMHAMLRDRGALEGALVVHGYWGVLNRATSKAA